MLLPLLQNNLLTAGAYILNAEPGSYLLTGFAATLVYTPELNAEPGAYVLTGFSAELLAAQSSSGEHRLAAIRALEKNKQRTKPYRPVDWSVPIVDEVPLTPSPKPTEPAMTPLSDVDLEIQFLMRSAIDVNDASFTTPVADLGILEKKKKFALLLLLMAA